LAFEKEVLGFYISGHPLEEYESFWRKNITAITSDFIVDEETRECKVHDGEQVWIGGMISSRKVKTTKTNKMMAFITLEDTMGSVEVLVFPNIYEKKRELFVEEEKLFIQGRVALEDAPVGKLICERAVSFKEVPRELWLQFEDYAAYKGREKEVLALLREREGRDRVIIYLKKEKAKKILPANWQVKADQDLLEILTKKLGEKNVRIVEKSIEMKGKMI